MYTLLLSCVKILQRHKKWHLLRECNGTLTTTPRAPLPPWCLDHSRTGHVLFLRWLSLNRHLPLFINLIGGTKYNFSGDVYFRLSDECFMLTF